MWTNTPGIGSTRASQPSSSNHAPSCFAAANSVRDSPVPMTTVPGSMIITSPPSIAPAEAILQIGIPASS